MNRSIYTLLGTLQLEVRKSVWFHNTHFQGFVWGSQELISRRAAVAAESETTPGKLIKKSRLQMESPNDPTKKALFEAGFVAESVLQTFTNKKIQH